MTLPGGLSAMACLPQAEYKGRLDDLQTRKAGGRRWGRATARSESAPVSWLNPEKPRYWHFRTAGLFCGRSATAV